MKDLTDFMKGYIDAATDYGQGWMGLELSDDTIKSHVETSDNYSKEYVEGYMVSVTNLRNIF
jgi:hypothetical protein